VAATTPSRIAQNILCNLGGSGLPPEVIMSITIDPESEEVTKKEIITNIATSDKNLVKGKYLKNSNKAIAILV